MASTNSKNLIPAGISRQPHCVAVYRRRMPVSLARMFENALDWQHLPHLHSGSFTSINCLSAGDWGWRATARLAPLSASRLAGESASASRWAKAIAGAALRQPRRLAHYATTLLQQTLAMQHGANVELELLLDTSKRRWVTTTLSGPGAGSSVVTDVVEYADRDIEVVVQFVIPGVPAALHQLIGQYYQQLYSVLYDEDESMMRHRQIALDTIKHKAAIKPVSLGPLATLKTQLPKQVEHGGKLWRVVTVNNELVAHSTLCPHMLGPLGEADVVNGIIECPWHGYRFNLATGQQLNGRCKLASPPAITVANNGQVTLG